MGGVIIGTVAIALTVAISPMRTLAVILVLTSNRARQVGPLYLVGFVTGITLVTALGLALGVSVNLGDRNNPPSAFSLAIFGTGLLLLGLAFWVWNNRPKDQKDPVLPRWLRSIESLSPLPALGLGLGLSVFSFKNLGLILAATLLIAQADLSPLALTLLAISFVVVACLGTALPVGWFVFAGAHAKEDLAGWREWLTRHNSLVTAISTALGGLFLIGKGLGGLIG